MVYTAAVAATETTDGNVAYWYCSGCGKYFSDEACTNELSSVTIPATGESSTGGDTSGGETSGGDTSGGTTTDDQVVDSTKTVKKISVATEPTITYYEVGDTFSVEGGTILVEYTDGTTDTLPMTSSSFTYNTPGMDSTGTRTVIIYCGTKSARFSITVSSKSYTVTFNYNYDGAPEAETVKYISGEIVEEITAERSGYTLYGWYVDADYTEMYTFGSGASENLDLYALWLTEGASTVTVTFDYDYYGAALVEYSYPVEAGTAVNQPSDPERTGYAFNAWLSESGSAYDFTTVLTSDTTITASWTKTVSGTNSYVFEAEDTDLTGKTGSAYSGTASATGMIVSKEGKNCSNDRCVTYLYDYGDSLEFYIASDEDVSDVTFEISLSQEMVDYTYTYNDFTITLNGEQIKYSDISFTGVPAAGITSDCLEFQYYTLAVNLTLKKGANKIQLITTNNSPISGTTIKATAPMVDCIRLTTTAVVTWDANYNLPMTGNYK